MPTHTPQVKEAVRLLGLHTQGSFEIYMLAGPGWSRARQDIMTAMFGVPKKLPKSQCGITAIESTFIDFFKPTGSCAKAVRSSLADACRELLAAE